MNVNMIGIEKHITLSIVSLVGKTGSADRQPITQAFIESVSLLYAVLQSVQKVMKNYFH